jgi:hypothetical protein
VGTKTHYFDIISQAKEKRNAFLFLFFNFLMFSYKIPFKIAAGEFLGHF